MPRPLCLFLVACLAPLVSDSAELKPETLSAFRAYVATQEKRIQHQNNSEKDFLWIDLTAERKAAVEAGESPVENLGPPEIPGGMIQHWVGGIFLPKTTLASVTKLDQDYARHKVLYQPDIIDSRVLSNKGNHFEIYYRFRKQKVVTVVLDTTHAVDYQPIRANRLYVRSRSTRIQEVEDAGESSERLLAEGKGEGFLWAMNSYWRMEERNGGVAMECEAITLARAIPQALNRMLWPIVSSFARESLTNTLSAKKRTIAGNP